MKITIKNMRKYTKKGAKLLAFLSVELEGVGIINDCKLIQGDGGAFVGMPSHKGNDDKYYSYVKLDKELNAQVALAAQEAYDKLVLKAGKKSAEDEVPY